MSRRASWSVVVVDLTNCSPVSCCSGGSIAVSNPAAFMHEASRFRTSLCRRIGRPPWGQLSAWSISRGLPQTHVVGNAGTGQPYRRQRASRNAPFGRANPWSAIGRAVSQLEAPFSLATSLACCICSGRCWWTSSAVALAATRASRRSSALVAWGGTASSGRLMFPVRSRTRLDVSLSDALCCSLAIFEGIAIPRPPCRAGRASRLRSMSLDGARPVIAGKSRWWRPTSSGWSRCSMSGIVRTR